jgi:hypothetical protein
MKKMKKNILIATMLLFSQFIANAQVVNLVNVVAFGDGKSKEDALNAALRHCIEKTFGVFVTTNTQVVNDELIKEDIATIASGNIVSYEVINELQNGQLFSVSVSAIVSPENIVKSYKNKGYSFEINGNVYAQNIQKEKFYKEQEPKIVTDLLRKYVSYPIFDTFEIKIGEPYFCKGSYDYREGLHENRGCIEIDASQKFKNKLFPEESFPEVQSFGYLGMHLWAFTNTKNWKDENVNRKSNGHHYSIPVYYQPHFNEINAAQLSLILTTFFDKISIKENDYEMKFGELYKASFAFPRTKNKEGKIEKILSGTDYKQYNFRSFETIKIINEFSKILNKKSTPNSLKLKDISFTPQLVSFWLNPQYENNTSIEDFYNQNQLPPIYKFIDSNPLSKLIINLTSPIDANFMKVSKSKTSYSYRPSLLIFKITESELSKLKLLEFSWE